MFISLNQNILVFSNYCFAIKTRLKTERLKKPGHIKIKQAPVGTEMFRARNLRWGMLLHVNEAGIYGGQNKIGVLVRVHVYHVGIAICT